MPIWKCNGKEKVNNNQKKRIYFKILNLLLVIILAFSVASVGGCSMESKQGAKGAKAQEKGKVKMQDLKNTLGGTILQRSVGKYSESALYA